VFGVSGSGDTSRGVVVLGGGGKVNTSVGGGGKNEAGGIGNLIVSRGEGPADRGEGEGEGPGRIPSLRGGSLTWPGGGGKFNGGAIVPGGADLRDETSMFGGGRPVGDVDNELDVPLSAGAVGILKEPLLETLCILSFDILKSSETLVPDPAFEAARFLDSFLT
jgi:hypothetical protein